MTTWFSGKSYADTVAWSKILMDKATDKIVVAHIVGHSGEELIHVFALVMKFNTIASQLKESPFAFPTFSSDVKSLF